MFFTSQTEKAWHYQTKSPNMQASGSEINRSAIQNGQSRSRYFSDNYSVCAQEKDRHVTDSVLYTCAKQSILISQKILLVVEQLHIQCKSVQKIWNALSNFSFSQKLYAPNLNCNNCSYSKKSNAYKFDAFGGDIIFKKI